ncbi:MAG: anti-sigma factor [Gemmatimonadales bacterium]
MSTGNDIHLSAEQIQAFLEGDLPIGGRERRRVEGHLAVCPRCTAELDAWRSLFADLSELAAQPVPPSRPSFADRVMAGVRIEHLAGDVLQDLADGLLPEAQAARARAHLAACATCGGELDSWRGLMGALARAQHFAPGETFADRVMAALPARQTAAVVGRAPIEASARPMWDRALVHGRRIAGRMIPRSRRAWAALSGVAVTPAAIFGLVLWVVFSHPTLTPQALASFALWQISDLLAVGWNGLLTGGLELVSTARYESVLQTVTTLTRSPLVLAGGALAYAAVAIVALRVLYKNLIGRRAYAGTHARIPSR